MRVWGRAERHAAHCAHSRPSHKCDALLVCATLSATLTAQRSLPMPSVVSCVLCMFCVVIMYILPPTDFIAPHAPAWGVQTTFLRRRSALNGRVTGDRRTQKK